MEFARLPYSDSFFVLSRRLDRVIEYAEQGETDAHTFIPSRSLFRCDMLSRRSDRRESMENEESTAPLP